MTFGQRLRELRIAQGMTQRELAQKAAISYTYVSKLETGVMPPPRQKTILALAEVLCADDVETDELFGFAKKMPSELLENVDTGIIRMLRSLSNGDDTPVRELAKLQRLIADLKESETRDTLLDGLSVSRDGIFRALVENSPDGIVLLGSELEVLYENPSAARILGYKPGEFIGKDTLGVIHPEDMSKAARRLAKMIQNPDDPGSHAQLRVRHNDGTWRIVDVMANNLLHNPTVNGIIVVIHKISRHLRDELAWAEDTVGWEIAKEYHLTDSEYKILTMIVEGKSNPQIAEQLVVSPSTVRFHVTSILLKLGVTSRTEAAAIAVRRHLVD